MKSIKADLQHQVAVDSREYGISYTLFRNSVGKKMGVNSTDFQALDLLFYRGDATPSELSKYTGLSSGATTAMIDRLERLELVTRESNPNDRRGVIVKVKGQSAKKYAPLFIPVRDAQQLLLSQYSKEQLELISDYLKNSASIFEQHTD